MPKASLLGLALLATASSAHAAITTTQTQNYNLLAPGGSTSFTFNKHDTTLGALLNVTITTTVQKVGGSAEVDNEAGGADSGNLSHTVTINLSSGSVTLLDTGFSSIGSNLTAGINSAPTLGADDGDGAGFQSTGSDYAGLFEDSDVITQISNVNAFFWSGYQTAGAGTFSISLGSSQSVNILNFANATNAFANANAVGSVSVTYEYVPEPSAALLGGIGLLALLRRRRA